MNLNTTGIKRANENIINYLIKIGALYTDDDGIHASNPGIYPKKSLPQTANQSRDR